MGNLFLIYNEDHVCVLCKKNYNCTNLKDHFCDKGYHAISKVFLCKNCPENLNILEGDY